VSAFQLTRFSGPSSELDMHVSAHPALHKFRPFGYAPIPSVRMGQGAGMFLPR
jgi:hypothetical protein